MISFNGLSALKERQKVYASSEQGGGNHEIRPNDPSISNQETQREFPPGLFDPSSEDFTELVSKANELGFRSAKTLEDYQQILEKRANEYEIEDLTNPECTSKGLMFKFAAQLKASGELADKEINFKEIFSVLNKIIASANPEQSLEFFKSFIVNSAHLNFLQKVTSLQIGAEPASPFKSELQKGFYQLVINAFRKDVTLGVGLLRILDENEISILYRDSLIEEVLHIDSASEALAKLFIDELRASEEPIINRRAWRDLFQLFQSSKISETTASNIIEAAIHRPVSPHIFAQIEKVRKANDGAARINPGNFFSALDFFVFLTSHKQFLSGANGAKFASAVLEQLREIDAYFMPALRAADQGNHVMVVLEQPLSALCQLLAKDSPSNAASASEVALQIAERLDLSDVGTIRTLPVELNTMHQDLVDILEPKLNQILRR